MAQGKVKWFNDKKGFGFIDRCPQHPGDIFVHYSEIQMQGHRTLSDNDSVSFEITRDAKGSKAKNVVKL